MLVLGLLQIGGGCSDAMKLLAFFNLPNGKSMKDNKFKRIEDSIGSLIRDEAKNSIQNALEEEVRLTLKLENRENDFEKWKAKELDPGAVGVVVVYDIGWNKRSTRTRYNSISSHGVAIILSTIDCMYLIISYQQSYTRDHDHFCFYFY